MTTELLHIDCMAYMATQPDNAFDLAIVDPEYGRGEHGGVNRAQHGVKQRNGSVAVVGGTVYEEKNWDKEPAGGEYFSELMRVSKHQIIWGANYYKEILHGGRIVWDKLNDGADQCGAEIAYCSLNERVDIVRYMWRGMMQGKEVGSFEQQGNKKLNEKRIHPTQKPRKLYEWLLKHYAKQGQRILDTHLGSGSSAIAAHYFGCDFVGCELDPDYYKAMKERFRRETAQLALW